MSKDRITELKAMLYDLQQEQANVNVKHMTERTEIAGRTKKVKDELNALTDEL